MPKRKKQRAPRKNKNDAQEPKTDEAPPPAKKIAAVSSTSPPEDDQVSSCTALSVSNGAELQSEAPLSPASFCCTCCSFSTGIRDMLDDHMQQHKLKCPWCPFSSLSHLEVIHHCKIKHDHSTEMDTVPCLACMFCNFMTYIMECLETHIALKHTDQPTRYATKMISKQVSADVRRDDAVFDQTLSNENAKSLAMKLEAGSHSGAKSNPIVIDVEVSMDIKREALSGSVSEMCVKTADPCAKTADPCAKTADPCAKTPDPCAKTPANPSADSINKQTLVSYLLSDIEASKELKVECGGVEAKFDVRITEAAQSEMKFEKLYCLTCPYSSVSIDEVKCHTVGQHPVGAAAATCNLSGESVGQGDITFFCVKHSCTFSSFDCSSYQKHLAGCCAIHNTLTVLETARLKTTIMYVLDYLKKYNLSLMDVFCHLASSYLGIPLAANQVVSSNSCKLGSQIFVSPSNDNVNKSSIASSDHSSPPVTIFSHIPPHNQQTSSGGMPLSYSQQENTHIPHSDYVGTAQQLQCHPGVSSLQATSRLLDVARDQRVNILNAFSLNGVPSVLPVNSSSIPSDVPIYSSHVPVNSNMSLNLPTNANNVLANVPLNSSSIPSHVPVHANSVSSNVPMNSSNHPSNVPMNSSNHPSNVPMNSSNHPSNVLMNSSNHPSNGPINSSNQPSNVLMNSSNHPSNVPMNSSNHPSYVSMNSSNHPSNVPINSSNQPSNVPFISRNVLSNVPINSSSVTPNVPGNRSFQQPNQFPVNNVSNFLFDQTGNEKQQPAAFSAGPINQGTAAGAHNFLLGANSVSLASHHQPGVLINSGQCHVNTGSPNQTSLASNSAALINYGTASIPQNFPLTANPVSAVQQQPGILINSSQSHYVTNRHHQAFMASNSAAHTNTDIFISSDDKSLIGHSNSLTHLTHSANLAAPADLSRFKMGIPHQASATGGETFSNVPINGHQNQGVSGNINYTSNAGRPNSIAGMGQGTVCSIYQTSPVSHSNTIADRVVSGQQCSIFTTAHIHEDTAGGVKHISPANQLSTIKGSTVFEQKSGNVVTANLNQGTANINHTFPAGQGNNKEGRTVFGQQSGSLMTAGQNQGGPYHNSSQYNTVAGKAMCMPIGQSGMLTDTGPKQGPPGSLTYTASVSQPVTSLGYGQQPGNLMPAGLNHGIAGNRNQTPHATDPMVGQETYQARQHNINSTGLGTATQQGTSSANTILVFDMPDSDSRLHELSYGNQSRLPPVSFYQGASLNTQNQGQTTPSVESAGRSAGIGGQTVSNGMSRLQPTLPCHSVEQSSRSQFSSSSVSQTSQFTSQSDSVSSYFGLQTADAPGNNRIMCGALPEQTASTQTVLSVSTMSRASPLEAASTHPSHLNQGMYALRSVSVHAGSRMATSPHQAHPLRPVIISSLPPSRYHQSHAIGKANLGLRGAFPTGAHPRSSLASQIHRGKVIRQRQVVRGRGQANSPRLLSGSARASHSSANSNDGNDDDVIVTSGFYPEKPYQRQGKPSGFRLPVTQPQSENNHHERQIPKVTQPQSENNHHERQIPKVHVTASSRQESHPPQSRKMVDVGRHFENIACQMNSPDSVENIDVAAEDDGEIEDDVEILSVETRSGPIQGPGLEMSQKTRPTDNQTAARTQNNSVDWNMKDTFSSGLSDVFNSSARHPSRPPSNSHSSVRHTVPSRKELADGNMSAKQQPLARPPAYSEQKEMANKGSTFRNLSPQSSQIRAGYRQISPAGLSTGATGHKQMQQRPPSHPPQLQQTAPAKASTCSISSSSQPPAQTQQHPSVIILDADCLTPSRETNKNYSISKEPRQEVIVVDSDIPAEFEKTPTSCKNREASQDVIVLDADPSDQTETTNCKTAKRTEYVIILDADSSEKSVDKNSSVAKERQQAISNATVTRPSYSLPSTRGNKAMSVSHNVNKTQICTPRAHPVQPFTPASQGSSFNSRVPPKHGQHSFAGSNSITPATRSALQTQRATSASPVSARAASASPVSASHPNSYSNNMAAQKGPQPAFRGTNVQNRNWPRTASTATSASGFSSSSVVSTNVPAASISPVSVSHSNHSPNMTVTQQGPQSAFRGTHFHDKNGPRTVIHATSAPGLSNSSVVANDPVISSASIVARSEVSPGWSEKASIPVMPGKTTTPSTVMSCLSERSQPVTDSSSKDSNTNVKEHTELLDNKSNQSNVPMDLPALLLAKFKKCANLKSVKTVSQQSVVTNATAGISSQRTSLGGSAKEANPCPRASTSEPGECSDKTGEILSTSQHLPPLLKRPASSLSVSEDKATQEATALSGSSTATSLSAMDDEQIIIFDLDINETQSSLLSMDSEQIIIFDIDVNEQHPMQDQPANGQNTMLNASSDIEMTESSTRISPVRDRTQAVAPTTNMNLLHSVRVPENSTLATVSDRKFADDANCQSGRRIQTVDIVEQACSRLFNQLTNFPGTHCQLKDPPVLHNHLKDSPIAYNQLKDPPVLHNQVKDSPVLHNQMKDSPVLHNQMKDSPGLYNQLRDSPGLHDQRDSQAVTNHLENPRRVPLLATCVDPQTVRHRELQATNAGEASASSDCKELHTDSQTIPTGGAADSNSKVVTMEGRKPKRGIKKHGVDDTKKQRQRKINVTVEKEIGNKDSVVEDRVIRHSDRLLKSVVKDLQKSESDIDAPLSSGSEFHIEDEDLGGDTDSEWSDSPEKNNKVKQKQAFTPLDPTAFNISLRGSYRCWLCRKIYSRCMFAKQHIVNKHLAGLCVIDLDRSNEAKSLCLLMFCPRSCNYATSTLDAMNSHMQTCNSKPLLVNQEINYMEKNRDFLDQKYIELLNTPLEAVLHPIIVRKPKDPTKVPRAKKSKAALGAETVSRPTPHAVVPFTNTSAASSAPGTPLGHTTAARTVVSAAAQKASFTDHNMLAQRQNQVQKPTSHSTASPAAVRTHISHQQRSNPCVANNSQHPMQHSVSPASRAVVPRDITPNTVMRHSVSPASRAVVPRDITPNSVMRHSVSPASRAAVPRDITPNSVMRHSVSPASRAVVPRDITPNSVMRHSVSPASRAVVPRDITPNFRLQKAQTRSLQSPEQQFNTSQSSAASSVSASYHLNQSCRMDHSTDHEDICMVEENGIICLE